MSGFRIGPLCQGVVDRGFSWGDGVEWTRGLPRLGLECHFEWEASGGGTVGQLGGGKTWATGR